jgi:DNA primase
VYELLVALGLDLDKYVITDQEIRGVCPCHEEADNPNSFVYYLKNGLWFCWTQRCDQQKGADLVALISMIKGFSPNEARDFARAFLKKQKITSNKIAKLLKLRKLEKAKKKDWWKEHLSQHTYTEKDFRNKTRSPASYIKSRGLNLRLMKKIGVGYAEDGPLHDRVVFPVRNVADKIVGFTGRAVRDDFQPKWKHMPGFQSGLNLFNIDRCVHMVRATQTIILVEGPIDTIKLEMAGYNLSAAVFGLSVSAAQAAILEKCGVVYTILGFDPDKVDSEPVRRSALRLREHDFDVRILRWKGDDDIGAMSERRVARVLDQVNDIPNFDKWRMNDNFRIER